jgi:hypothetical protein
MDCFPVACDQLVETVSGWLYVPTVAGWGGRIRTRDGRRFSRGIVVNSSMQTGLVFFQLKRCAQPVDRDIAHFARTDQEICMEGADLVVMTGRWGTPGVRFRNPLTTGPLLAIERDTNVGIRQPRSRCGRTIEGDSA